MKSEWERERQLRWEENGCRKKKLQNIFGQFFYSFETKYTHIYARLLPKNHIFVSSFLIAAINILWYHKATNNCVWWAGVSVEAGGRNCYERVNLFYEEIFKFDETLHTMCECFFFRLYLLLSAKSCNTRACFWYYCYFMVFNSIKRTHLIQKSFAFSW